MKRPLHYDIRAEVWAARQKKRGLDLIVRPQGTFSRPYKFDILNVTALDADPETGVTHGPLVAYVDISREGVYDMLPEALSHPPRAVKDGEGSQALVNESRRLRQEERDNRTFWLPFEQETYRQRIQIEEQENQTLTQTTGPVWAELYAYLLGEAGEGLTDSQRACLLSVWTNAHQTVGNWERTAYYFSRFLDVPVRIKHGLPAPIEGRRDSATDWQPARLGESRLGLDYVLPQTTTITDDGGLIRLAFGPLTAEQLREFLPGGAALRHVSMLAGYLLPADADWQIEVLPDEMNGGFVLSDLGSSGRLGLTTTLN
ncbi:type VI secretion system baseplate subunit TssG [Spirosoma fluminis]